MYLSECFLTPLTQTIYLRANKACSKVIGQTRNGNRRQNRRQILYIHMKNVFIEVRR